MDNQSRALVVPPEHAVTRARRIIGAVVAASAGVATIAQVLAAHDLFLRPKDFMVREGSTFDVRVLNGTFTSSEALVAPERLNDLSVVGPNGRTNPDRGSWTGAGKESSWRVSVDASGTYVIGASLTPKTIRLTGGQFNDYLKEEGLPDVLDARRKTRTLGDSAHERYAKHVKSLIRVGEPLGAAAARTDTAFRLVLGYPAEIIPLDNPYRGSATSIAVRALVDGSAAANQVVLYGGRDGLGKRIPERRVRTNADGVARLSIAQRGTWYVKFIRMLPVAASTSDSVTHESKWATLTFATP